jgi:hypothetical protein
VISVAGSVFGDAASITDGTVRVLRRYRSRGRTTVRGHSSGEPRHKASETNPGGIFGCTGRRAGKGDRGGGGHESARPEIRRELAIRPCLTAAVAVPWMRFLGDAGGWGSPVSFGRIAGRLSTACDRQRPRGTGAADPRMRRCRVEVCGCSGDVRGSAMGGEAKREPVEAASALRLRAGDPIREIRTGTTNQPGSPWELLGLRWRRA